MTKTGTIIREGKPSCVNSIQKDQREPHMHITSRFDRAMPLVIRNYLQCMFILSYIIAKHLSNLLMYSIEWTQYVYTKRPGEQQHGFTN